MWGVYGGIAFAGLLALVFGRAAGGIPRRACADANPAHSQSRGDAVWQLQIRARTDRDADCLMRELAAYSPARSGRAITVELEERSETTVLGVLAAVETCLTANEIRSVRIELDGRSYMLAASS
jgi:hypothetical protein